MRLNIDESLCWGCKTCEAACKQENHAPTGIRLLRVTEEGPLPGVDGKLAFTYRVNRCLHCEEPACVPVCPVEALTKREDSLVVLDGETCVGCGACVDACPFEAIGMDERAGVARKCNLCHHRLDRGLYPACADNVCLAHCIALTDD